MISSRIASASLTERMNGWLISASRRRLRIFRAAFTVRDSLSLHVFHKAVNRRRHFAHIERPQAVALNHCGNLYHRHIIKALDASMIGHADKVNGAVVGLMELIEGTAASEYQAPPRSDRPAGLVVRLGSL